MVDTDSDSLITKVEFENSVQQIAVSFNYSLASDWKSRVDKFYTGLNLPVYNYQNFYSAAEKKQLSFSDFMQDYSKS